MKKNYLILILLFLCCLGASAQTITGTVLDNSNNEPMLGAIVVVKGTTIGTSTDLDGKFSLDVKQNPPFVITVSLLGFEPQDINVTEANINKPFKISLGQTTVQVGQVVVVDSRLTEKEKESPLTVESMGITAIKETPAANFYEGLGLMKGVDVNSASIGFKVINTRGFNSTSPVRSLQLIDGVDNQSPGLNFSLGNFLGASELDVQKVDLIVGASSAYYGPNAFNGVISISTKDPFIHKGLSVSLKGGERGLFEGAVRFADVVKNKKDREVFAYKLNLYYMRAHDWEADNLDPVTDATEGTSNPGGYDAVNRYGDENLTAGQNNATSINQQSQYPGLKVYHRTGYEEKDLVDYNSQNAKASVAFHFKPTEKIQVIIGSNFGTGTTVYQGDNRYSLKNILFFQNKLEIKQDGKFFVRFYATNENAGDSYDAVFTAFKLQDAVKSDADWSTDYRNYWARYITPKVKSLDGFPPGPTVGNPFDTTAANAVLAANQDSIVYWHELARAYADSSNNIRQTLARLTPGTAAFDSVFNSIISKNTYGEGGTHFYDKSALYHVQAEYKLSPKQVIDITMGTNFRLYMPNSRGTIFSDTAGRVIRNYELGFYLGLEKKFWHDKIKVDVTSRLDKNQNFPVLVSPAASFVITPVKDHTFRLSFSAAIRNPTLQDQYLYYNVGRAILVGNLTGFDSLVTTQSLIDALGGAAIDKNKLEYFNVAPVVPEKVKSVEIGYRGVFFNKVYIDGSYYFSFYKDFIGYQIGTKVYFDELGGFDLSRLQTYRVASNAKSQVTTQGFSVALNYYFWKWLAFNANYSWNVLNKKGTDDPLIPAFNTPENKFNVGISGRDIAFKKGNEAASHWGFSVNYKWVQGYLYEGSPQFTGYVPTYDMVDIQINKEVPKIYCTFKIGASNLLNNKKFQVYGGPRIGRLAYASILFDFDKIRKK